MVKDYIDGFPYSSENEKIDQDNFITGVSQHVPASWKVADAFLDEAAGNLSVRDCRARVTELFRLPSP